MVKSLSASGVGPMCACCALPVKDHRIHAVVTEAAQRWHSVGKDADVSEGSDPRSRPSRSRHQRYAVSQLPEASFPSAIPASTAALPIVEPTAELAEIAATAADPAPSRRWSGRTTALVAAGVLAVSGVGAVAAAAATPNGISAPSSGGFGGPGQGGPRQGGQGQSSGGRGVPGQGQLPGQGQPPGQGQFPDPGQFPGQPPTQGQVPGKAGTPGSR